MNINFINPLLTNHISIYLKTIQRSDLTVINPTSNLSSAASNRFVLIALQRNGFDLLSYDPFGFPTIYKNNQCSFFRNLLSNYGQFSFEYDLNQRLTKVFNNNVLSTKIEYFDDRIINYYRYVNGNTYLIKPIYGLGNDIIGFGYNNNIYFVIKNILNDVVAIYDENQNLVCYYSYDAYGNCLAFDSQNNIISNPIHIGNLFPFKYRGYYFVNETGLYWLSSRFYDPEIERFISPDSVDYLDPTSINGLNLYAYCNNDPVNYCDPSGHLAFWIAAMIAGACVGTGYAFYKDWQDGGIDGSIGVVGYLGYALGGAAIGAITGLAASSLLAGSFTASCGQVWVGAKGLAWAYTMGGAGGAGLYMANNFFNSIHVDSSWLGYWPSNNGFSGLTQTITLQPGTSLQRIGGTGGTFVAPYYTDPMSLSLPYNQIANMYNPNVYIVNSPIIVTAGQVAPWFGQYGGGIQYILPMSIQELLDSGILSIF